MCRENPSLKPLPLSPPAPPHKGGRRAANALLCNTSVVVPGTPTRHFIRSASAPWPGRSCRQTSGTLGNPNGSRFCAFSNSGSRRMDRDRHERPRVVCPLAVSGDRCSGLASLDANHSHGQIPQERFADEPSGHGICSERRAAMAGTWCGLPNDTSSTARLHAFGMLGVWLRRTMVCSDRLGAGPERQLVVRDAGLDRTGFQVTQTRRLAMADDPDDRPRV